jgi:hypothetical protein
MNPFFAAIPLPWKILGALAAVVSIYGAGYYGGYSGEHKKFEAYKVDQQIADLKVEAKFNEELRVRSDKLMTDYNANLAQIINRGSINVTTAREVVPHQYDLSNGWISLHDRSARAQPIDPTAAADATSSGIGDNSALATVVNNYARCDLNAKQLTALQTWIENYNEAAAAAEKDAKKKKGWFGGR